MSPLKRTLIVAACTWALWLGLIALSAPHEPAGVVLGVFVASFGAALAGCLWAQWQALPGIAAAPLRRLACIALGLGVFLGVTLVGHVMGKALAETLAA